MGEARRRKLNPPRMPSEEEAGRIANAVRKIAEAASTGVGTDCMVHADMTRALLQHLGYEAELVAGEAAWRVGNGTGDVILHGTFGEDMHIPAGYFPYHAWVETGTRVLDCTTYQLVRKGEELDLLDGGTTCVAWHPDYLFVERNASSPMHDVQQLHAGLFHYRKDGVITTMMRPFLAPLDESHLAALIFTYENPHINVIGPNQMP